MDSKTMDKFICEMEKRGFLNRPDLKTFKGLMQLNRLAYIAYKTGAFNYYMVFITEFVHQGVTRFKLAGPYSKQIVGYVHSRMPPVWDIECKEGMKLPDKFYAVVLNGDYIWVLTVSLVLYLIDREGKSWDDTKQICQIFIGKDRHSKELINNAYFVLTHNGVI